MKFACEAIEKVTKYISHYCAELVIMRIYAAIYCSHQRRAVIL